MNDEQKLFEIFKRNLIAAQQAHLESLELTNEQIIAHTKRCLDDIIPLDGRMNPILGDRNLSEEWVKSERRRKKYEKETLDAYKELKKINQQETK